MLLDARTQMWMTDYVGILATLATLLVGWRICYAFFFSPLRKIPGPFLARVTSKRGIIAVLTGNATTVAQRDYEDYGDVYLSKPNGVFVCDPEDARAVLSSNEFRKTPMYRIFEYDGIPNVSTLLDPVDANRRRRLLHPFFGPGYLAKMESLILKHGPRALKARWDRQLNKEGNSTGGKTITVNYRFDTQLATFDVTGALVFGRDLHALENNNHAYTSWVNNTLSYMLLAHYFPFLKLFPFSLAVRALRNSYDNLAEFSKEAIALRRAYLESGGEKPADLLQALLDAEDPDSKVSLSADEVQAESIAMLVGGSESTSSVISWTIHFLLLYPEHLAQATAEVRAKFAAEATVTYAQSRVELPYLEACVYETLRCIPTASTSFPRVSPTKDMVIKGFRIPAGTEIATNKCAAHIHSQSWADPFDFNPARFINNPEAKRNMLSFAYGTRLCIGRNLAWVLMMVVLANIFKDYDVALAEDSLFRPDNVDSSGRPKIMPTKLGVATMPANPERDCRMVLSKRVD